MIRLSKLTDYGIVLMTLVARGRVANMARGTGNGGLHTARDLGCD